MKEASLLFFCRKTKVLFRGEVFNPPRDSSFAGFRRKRDFLAKEVFFRSTPSLLCQRGVFCPTCPSPAGGSLIPNQAFPLTIKGKDVTALRCSEPLRSKVGGASKPSPCFAGWDRLGTACFWLHCAWGQLASFPRHILRAGTAAWGTLKVKNLRHLRNLRDFKR